MKLESARSAHVMLTLTALCLAGNFVIARSVHGEVPPVGLSFWRWAIGALFLAPFVLPGIREQAAVYRAHAKLLLQLGLILVASTTLLFIALNFTTALNVSLIITVQPALTVLLAAVFLHDRLSKFGILGVMVTMLGVVAMLSMGDLGVLTNLRFNAGDLIAIAAMFGLAFYALSLRKLPQELSVVEALFGITVAGSVSLLPFYILESIFYAPVPMKISSLIVSVELALLVSVFGNLMWNFGNRIIGPGRAAIFMNLIPLFGAILAIIFLREKIYNYHLAGGAAICLGVWLVVGTRKHSVQPD